MPPRLITLAYRKLIDANSTKPWDKLVFADSYREFRMQSQLYNQQGQYRTFGELLHHVPGADRLHFLVGGSIGGYVQQLNGVVPDIVNNVGRYFLKFSGYQFELINSSLHDQSRHQVAVNFYSEPLLWHDGIGGRRACRDQRRSAYAPLSVATLPYHSLPAPGRARCQLIREDETASPRQNLPGRPARRARK